MFANTVLPDYLCTAVKNVSLPTLLVVTLASSLWLPNLFCKGMFMDGVYNAFFALNINNGIGSLWSQQTIYHPQPAYWDNPQLSSLLLSYWFKILGDAYWVERVYSLFTGLAQLVLIGFLWRTYFQGNKSVKKYFWLPCLLFLFSPITSWCYANNLMENSMCIFTTTAVLLFIAWLRNGQYILPFAFPGGALVVLAVITKGPVGLFPLAIPLFFVFDKNRSRMQLAAYLLIQLIAFASVFYTVFSPAPAANFLSHYLQLQLLPVLTERTEGNSNHLLILYELLRGLLPLLLAGFAAFFFLKNSKTTNAFFPDGIAFLLIGLSASAPIAFSSRQHHYYLLPSLPLFAFGFAVLTYPFAFWLIEKIESVAFEKIAAVLKYVCVLLITATIFMSKNNYGTYVRDENLLKDIEAIQPLVKEEKLLNADYALYHEWSLRGYLYRFHSQKICMPDENVPAKFFLTKPETSSAFLPVQSEKIFSGKVFDLYYTKP